MDRISYQNVEELPDPFQGSPYLVDEILNAVRYMCSMNISRYAKRNARGKMQILASIIEICTMGQKKKTHIIYKSYLSGRQGQHYIDVLLRKGLIIQDLSDDVSGMYRTTQKGREYLSHYHRMMELIEDKEEELEEEENSQHFLSPSPRNLHFH
jgi:predicted transcriptional regulator